MRNEAKWHESTKEIGFGFEKIGRSESETEKGMRTQSSAELRTQRSGIEREIDQDRKRVALSIF